MFAKNRDGMDAFDVSVKHNCGASVLALRDVVKEAMRDVGHTLPPNSPCYDVARGTAPRVPGGPPPAAAPSPWPKWQPVLPPRNWTPKAKAKGQYPSPPDSWQNRAPQVAPQGPQLPQSTLSATTGPITATTRMNPPKAAYHHWPPPPPKAASPTSSVTKAPTQDRWFLFACPMNPMSQERHKSPRPRGPRSTGPRPQGPTGPTGPTGPRARRAQCTLHVTCDPDP